jgi:hypothetical protein
VPGAAIRIGLGVGRRAEGMVGLAALGRRRPAVGGRAHQRMPEHDAAADLEQPLLDRRGGYLRSQAEVLRGCPHHEGITDRFGRRDDQQALGGCRQRGDAPREAGFDPVRHGCRGQQAEAAGHLCERHRPWQLQER